MRVTRTFLGLLVAGALLGLVGCSDDGGDDSAVDAGEATTTSSARAGEEPTPTTGEPPTSDGPAGTAVPLDPEHVSERYAEDDYWLCRPGLEPNPCEEDLDVTVLHEDGTTEARPHQVADDPSFDCFYVYPTINLGDEGNAPFDGEYGPEIGITRLQAGPFSRQCRVYAPLYRQVTLAAFPRSEAEGLGEVAYGDVLDAFEHYLANDNDGRPILLLGHSQGSGVLRRLISETFDVDPDLRSHLIAGYLIGTTVEVPVGEETGGSFRAIPPCRRDGQVACVVSYASFAQDEPPGDDAFFGRASDDEHRAVCTNPAALAGGLADLRMVTTVTSDAEAEYGVATDTPFVALPGFVSGQCVERDGFSYLEVMVNAGPGPRVDELTGGLGPQWGLHALDYNLVLDDLVDLAGSQAAAWAEQAGGGDGGSGGG